MILLRLDWRSPANRALLLGLGAAEARFWAKPHRVICLIGAGVVPRMPSRKPREDPMTRPKSKETVTRSRPVRMAKRKSSKRPLAVDAGRSRSSTRCMLICNTYFRKAMHCSSKTTATNRQNFLYTYYRDLTSPEKPASANIPSASPAIR